MSINIQHLARLAKLALTPKQAEDLQHDLSHLEPIINAIQSVNTNVNPLNNPLEQVQTLRTDKVTEPDRRKALQQSAPSAKDGYYLVPQVIES